MKLEELLNLQELEAAFEAGHVNVQQHPTLPLAILNYTHRCQYDRAWTPLTRQCRGLIYNTETGEIVARPWPKFFNYGEHEVCEVREGNDPPVELVVPTRDLLATLDPDALVEVTDKLDGSLGILYPVHSLYGVARQGWAIATRGSFTSDQALHATDNWQSQYAPVWEPEPGWTYLFEIIYPENRIVVDYGAEDDLHMIGRVKIETGEIQGPALDWPGPMAGLMQALTLRDALALPPREGKEGVVVRLLETGALVKIKQEDYVELHRIVTHLNERTIWEALGAGKTYREICEPLPDEFHEWVRDVCDGLVLACGKIEVAATKLFGEGIKAVSLCGNRDWTRRDFAEWAKQQGELTPYMFLLLDGKKNQLRASIWKSIKPASEKPVRDRGEEIA